MKTRKRPRIHFIGIVLFLVGAGTGCSIKQTVKPMEFAAEQIEICILQNRNVRHGFLDAYADALKEKNFQVKTLADNASLNECATTSTYTAHWAWDLALYMRYAEIKVYRNAALVGEAVYDATWGGGRLDKFINAENKIREMVNELFLIRKAQVSNTPSGVSAVP